MTRLPVATYSISLLASLTVSIPFAGLTSIPARADTNNSVRPAVEVNLNVLKYSAPQLTLPIRIIDGGSVIVLTPPSFQKKTPAVPSQNIVKPLVKPALTLPETDVAAAKPIPVPPVNPEKLPEPAEETKFDDVATPVVKMDTAPIPTPEVIEETKEEVAEIAAEKVTETAATPTQEPIKAEPADSIPVPERVDTAAATSSSVTEKQPEAEAAAEIKLAAISPDAGPTAATAASNANDNLTRILFAEGAVDLPTEAQTTLQVIADQVKDGDRRNVQLLAYGSGNSVSAARRLSLGRALAVRSKLMDLGVDNKQIEVRALGQPEGDEPSDRVDLLMISR